MAPPFFSPPVRDGRRGHPRGRHAWKPRSKLRSPCWTTRWKDLPSVKA